MLTATRTAPRLTAQDRCDASQSEQALFVATKDDNELILCEHHKNEFAPGLIADGWKIEKADIA